MWRYIKRSFLINAILLLLAGLALYGAFGVVRQALNLRREARDVGAKVEELNRKKEELERYLEEIQTPQVIEREAKERLNLKLPGEEVVVVREEGPREPSAEPQDFLKRIKSFFLK